MIRRAVSGRLGRRGASGEPAVLAFAPSSEGTVRKGSVSRATAPTRVATSGLGNPVAGGFGQHHPAARQGDRSLPISHGSVREVPASAGRARPPYPTPV